MYNYRTGCLVNSVFNYRTGCLVNSVYNYQSTQQNIPGDDRTQYIPNMGLKTKVTFIVLASNLTTLFSCRPAFETLTATQHL